MSCNYNSMVGLLVIKVVIKWFVYVCKLKKNARLYILNDVSFSINWRDVCSGLDTSRRCSLLWAIWRGRIVSQYTVSLSSVSPTVLCRSLTISSFSFEWFHSVKTCYGCSHIMTGAGREGGEGGGRWGLPRLVDCFLFWARLVPGQEDSGWVQWQKLGGLLQDNGGSQAADDLPTPRSWHQLVF